VTAPSATRRGGEEAMLHEILVRCLFAPPPGQTRAAALAPPPPGT